MAGCGARGPAIPTRGCAVSSAPLSRILDALPDHKPAGKGFLARCPAHEDRQASLSVTEGHDGKVLLRCHAGCPTPAIVGALGLDMRDLFATPDSAPRAPRTIAATYPYRDEAGALLFEVVRFCPKDFRQRRPDGAGGWHWNLENTRRVVYRLPELQRQRNVIVAEGEKDADRLAALGLPATTSPAGAGKWSPDYSAQLVAAGAQRIAILPDHDAAGDAHARDVARSCLAAGLTVRVVRLDGLPPKGDVSDWLDMPGHDAGALRAALNAAPALAADDPWLVEPQHTSRVIQAASGFTFTSIGDLLSEPEEHVEWLVDQRIPGGSVVLVVGKPKSGKSTTVRCLTLASATGGQWLGHQCVPATVWYLALEEKRGEVRKHFRMMGATGREPIRFFINQAPADIVPQLASLAEQERPGLIVIDTLQRFIRAKDLNDYAEVTLKLDPVLHIARTSGAALVLLHHNNKVGAGLDAVLGSTALTGSVDNIISITRHEHYRVIATEQRIGPNLPETIIRLDEGTGIVGLGGSRLDAEVDEIAGQMIDALTQAGVPLTQPDLYAAVEGRTDMKRRAIKVLASRGQAIVTGTGRKGDPLVYKACSLVPLKGGDKHFSLSRPDVTPRDSDRNACPRVPARMLVPDVPTATAPDGAPGEEPDVFRL